MNKDNLQSINDTIIHKQYVLKSCLKLANILFDEQKNELALDLLKRACIHDNSKLEEEELLALSRIINDKDCLTNSKEQLSEFKKNAIALHWKNNRHHPEFFSDINNMTELDILEMICDWYARSMQYNTNFLEFVYDRQKNRFHFPEQMFKVIENYCILISK